MNGEWRTRTPVNWPTAPRDSAFDELKIDRGFVHGAWLHETQRALFDASPGIAMRLGMEAVPEGVEDRNDWDFLQRKHGDLAQGYFIARPMPADAVPARLARWSQDEHHVTAA